METILESNARSTKYAIAICDLIQPLGHATNLELLNKLQVQYPEVSATTVHRVTARLKNRGVIGSAPKSTNGSERYDANPEPHHHFMCVCCDSVCDVADTTGAQAAINSLKELSKECAIAGTLVMQGVCTKCIDKEGK